jgi:hypothetical protein
LQDHFGVVLALLQASTHRSIETALERLEATQSTVWSSSERAAWRKSLLVARFLQLHRLADYCERGRFPINDGLACNPLPIFVDGRDTACAVGHLMRLSSYREAVACIVASDNYVYVPDVEGGPIADWILTSGLTLEEAALIQPAYPWQYEPAPVPDGAAQLTHEWNGEFGDLRFSNFQIFREADGIDLPPVNVPVLHNFCEPQFIGCIHSATLPVDTQYGAEYRRVLIQFDVDVLSPMQRIVGRPRASALSARKVGPYSRNDISLFVGRNLSEAFIDQPTTPLDITFIPVLLLDGPLLDHNGMRELELTQHMTVVTELLLRHGQSHQAQLMQFEVVTIPEPATWLLLMISATMLAGVGRSRRSARSQTE